MQSTQELQINGVAQGELVSFVSAMIDDKEDWKIELVLHARDHASLADAREGLEAALGQVIDNCAIIEGGRTLRQLSSTHAPIRVASIEWQIGKDAALEGSCKAKLHLQQASATIAGNGLLWQRTIQREGNRVQEIIKGSAKAAHGHQAALVLRDSFGTPDEESITSSDDGSETEFRFVYRQGGDGSEFQSRESISLHEDQSIVTHRPLAPSAAPIHQAIGAPRIIAEQRGEAEGAGSHPDAAHPLWPSEVVEREITREHTREGYRTHWRYRFLLPANPFGA